MNDKELQRIIGDNIRAFRKFRGLSRSELAEKVDVSDSFCANIESGNRIMSVPNLVKFANALNASLDSLVYKEHSNSRFAELEIRCRDKSDEFVRIIEVIAIELIDLIEDQKK